MPQRDTTMDRRQACMLGTAVMAGAILDPRQVCAVPRRPDEVRVLLLTGDVHHSAEMHETKWREVLGVTPWTVMVTRHASCVTPEVIASLDLLILCRNAGWDAFGFSPDHIVEERESPGYFMTGAVERAIVEGVHSGMGLIATHCSVLHPERRAYLDLLGIEDVGRPGLADTVSFDGFTGHPVLEGVTGINSTRDQVWPVTTAGTVDPLFTISGRESGRTAPCGWCRSAGDGRVAVLTTGHKVDVYHTANYKRVLWNAAHWTMGRERGDDSHISDD
jgi:type 1 glutamine amidotransferase